MGFNYPKRKEPSIWQFIELGMVTWLNFFHISNVLSVVDKMSFLVEYTEPQWRDLDMRKLHVDEAFVYIASKYPKTTYLYSLSDQCYACPYTKEKTLFTGNISVDVRDAAYATSLKVYAEDQGEFANDNVSSLCTLSSPYIQEFGVYNFTLLENGSCNFVVDKPGVPINYAFLSVFLLTAAFLLQLKCISYAWQRYRNDATIVVTDNPEEPKCKQRLRSLDTFRGLSIVLMIFVNSGGGGYNWIEHAIWNGIHLADVVFPSFLWIMGVCIPLSVHSQLACGISKSRICCRSFWRACKLFALGILWNSKFTLSLDDIRALGVMQRLAIGYLLVTWLHTLCSRTSSEQLPNSRDLLPFYIELLFLLVLVAIYLAVTFILPVPNCPLGYLGPGGKSRNGVHRNCTGGAAVYVDLLLLGTVHIFQNISTMPLYDTMIFEPEGAFGCLLTVAQVILGAFVGSTVLWHPTWQSRLKRWLLGGLLLGLLGGVLCGFSKDEGLIPINKTLWSLSFVCVTVALALALLSILHYVVDVRLLWSGYPFNECGMNAIILFAGHLLSYEWWPWHWTIGEMNTHFFLLLECVWNTLIWVGTALYLDACQFYYNL